MSEELRWEVWNPSTKIPNKRYKTYSEAEAARDAGNETTPGHVIFRIESRPSCPACGGSLIEIRSKKQCKRCGIICETCCEGGPQ
jgi:hypothetical protein